jgi:hypothetical protein
MQHAAQLQLLAGGRLEIHPHNTCQRCAVSQIEAKTTTNTMFTICRSILGAKWPTDRRFDRDLVLAQAKTCKMRCTTLRIICMPFSSNTRTAIKPPCLTLLGKAALVHIADSIAYPPAQPVSLFY